LPGGDDVAGRFIEALGGAANIREIEACTTRLRLVLGDRARVDARALVELGSLGTVNIGEDGMQVVVGPTADLIAGDIRARLAGSAQRDAPRAIIAAAFRRRGQREGRRAARGPAFVTVGDAAKIDEAALRASCARGFARPSPTSVHPCTATLAALRLELASLRI
jgi:PTS system N-acetylglucosamine-specific IIC component